MSLTWRNRLMIGFLGLAAVLAPTWLLNGAPAAAEPQASVAHQLLIATPAMGDPRFEHTVILMVRHDGEGAFGIVINRPLGERSLSELMAVLGQKEPSADGTVRIVSGGPVQPELGFVIHSNDYRRPDTVDVGGQVAMTANREILLDIGSGKGPQKRLIAFGYAGWGPGQLDAELATGAWTSGPVDPALVFDEDRDKVWDTAYSRRGRDL